ncbi:MAG TPA: septum formation family protein [Candidatus Dormibacteraeota bacterium]|nr:septum formation family protein [Candidatus Dormibacteraeota bacterium]
MGRWVCLRCYESNDAAVVSCSKCGLARGATPDPSEPATTDAVPAAPAARGPGWLGGVVRRFGWVIVVAVVAIAGFAFSAGRDDSGAISRGGNLAITDLRAGDCFNLRDREAEEIGEVDAKRCNEPHQFEMMFVGDMPAGAFPSDEALTDFTVANCLPAFEAYVGLAYETSRYDLYQFAPTLDGWNSGDHALQCALFDPLNDELSGSLRAANR